MSWFETLERAFESTPQRIFEALLERSVEVSDGVRNLESATAAWRADNPEQHAAASSVLHFAQEQAPFTPAAAPAPVTDLQERATPTPVDSVFAQSEQQALREARDSVDAVFADIARNNPDIVNSFSDGFDLSN